MEFFKSQKGFFKTFLVLSICFLLSMSCLLPTEKHLKQNECMTGQQILKLLEKNLDQKVIIENIEKYGADLKLNTETISTLVRAGASDQLLQAIEKYPCAALSIIFPENGAACGSTVKIEGLSRQFPGKFLWVFSHVKFLKNKWWPQVGVINVEPDGKWVTMAYLGGPQDIGFDFEIIAIWVDGSTSKMLTEYLNKADQTGNYPPMPLPKGSPSAKVVVKKIKH